jgi:hypothetical protein
MYSVCRKDIFEFKAASMLVSDHLKLPSRTLCVIFDLNQKDEKPEFSVNGTLGQEEMVVAQNIGRK